MQRIQVIVFSEVKWSYLRTRKGFLLSRFPADWPILYLEPMNRTDPNHLRPVRDGRLVVATLPVPKPKTSIGPMNRLLGLGAVRALLTGLTGIWVRRLIARYAERGLPRLFFLSNVLFMPIADRLPRDLLLYDANDDPLNFPGTPDWVGDYQTQTLRRADVVVSCSDALASRLRERGRGEITVIGNGVEAEHFGRPVEPARVPIAVREAPRPRIGYAGAIAEWFDFDLVGEVARAHPEASVILVGPVAAPVAARANELARAHPNVKFPGRVPYEDLPHVVRSFDVCLIPWRADRATDVANPNKLYEYLAAGRTVVSLAYSTDMERFKDWILLARSRQEFVARVGEALREPRDPRELMQVAAGESWDARARELLALVAARMPGESG